jgi:hypothetical protein
VVAVAGALAVACSGALARQYEQDRSRQQSAFGDPRLVHESRDIAVDGCQYLGDFVGSGSDRPVLRNARRAMLASVEAKLRAT